MSERPFAWIWVATLALFGASALLAPGTLHAASLAAMLPFAAMLAIVAVGQTLVIQQQGIDLSAGGMMTLAGALVAALGAAGASIGWAIAGALAGAAVLGACTGVLVARLHVTPIVATLAVNALLAGAVRTLSGGSPIAVPPALAAFAHQRWLGIPATLVLCMLFVAAVATVVARTPVGRRFVMAGANARAAAACGIPVQPYRIGGYAAAAVCFATAGVLYAGFIGSASPSAGDNHLLPGIAAVIVGGTSLSSGRGSVVASAVAALFMVQLGQMVLALGAGAALQLLVQAAALVLAATLRGMPRLLSRRAA